MRSNKSLVNITHGSLDRDIHALRNECSQLSITSEVSERQLELLSIAAELKSLKDDCLKALGDNKLRATDKNAYIRNVKSLIDSITEKKAALTNKIENDYNSMYQNYLKMPQDKYSEGSSLHHAGIIKSEAEAAEFLAHEMIVKFSAGLARMTARATAPGSGRPQPIAACSPLNTAQRNMPAQNRDSNPGSSNKPTLGLRPGHK